jgi:hypothetical protein
MNWENITLRSTGQLNHIAYGRFGYAGLPATSVTGIGCALRMERVISGLPPACAHRYRRL